MAETSKIVPISFGGVYGAGGAGYSANFPDGTSRRMENVLPRHGRWMKRPPLVSKNMTGVAGLMPLNVPSTPIPKLAAVKFSGTTVSVYVLNDTSSLWTGTTWTGPDNGTLDVTGTAAPSFINFKDTLYFTVTTGTAGYLSNPGPIVAFNETSNVVVNPLGGETIRARSIAAFVDRIILGDAAASVTNLLGTSAAYDPTGWSSVTTTTTNITNGSTVTGRITPTATTNSQIYKADVSTIAASTSEQGRAYRFFLRNSSPTYEMPMTTEIYYSESWVATTAYGVGAIRVPLKATAPTGNGFRYRATAAGTSGAGEPVWPTTVGTTVADGTVTWICDGKDAVSSYPFTLPTWTESQDFIPLTMFASFAPNPVASKIGLRLKFGTAAVGTIELAPVDFSLRDGRADDDPLKKNRGHQLTAGKFPYPFWNAEGSATATVDVADIVWTETSDTNAIRGSNTFTLREAPGPVTAMVTMGGRLIVFKQRGMWVFQGSDDPDNPLIKERFFGDVGCVGIDAWTVFEEKLYFVGLNEVFEYDPGGSPDPLFRAWGLGESGVASTPYTWVSADVDVYQRDLYVTQGPRVLVFDLDEKRWAYLKSTLNSFSDWGLLRYMQNQSGDGTMFIGIENVSGTVDVYAFDFYQAIKDGGTNSIQALIETRDLEFWPRKEFTIDAVGVTTSCTASQAAATFEVAIQADRADSGTILTGAATLPTVAVQDWYYRRTEIPIRSVGFSHNIVITHDGPGGQTSFTIGAIDAVVRGVGDSRVKTAAANGTFRTVQL